MARNYIGVDLSGAWLDVSDPRRGRSRVRNTEASVARYLGGLDETDLLVFEATSRCDAVLLEALALHGTAYARVNPLHAWHFAQSLNLPKTDRVDAAMLARMGRERRLPASAPVASERAVLAQLERRRDQLKRMTTQEKNRLAEARHRLVREQIEATLVHLAAQGAALQAAIRAHLAAHPALASDVAVLRSIPGVGEVTAVTLLARLPELGAATRREIASLGALAPKARESGKWKGQRRLGAGRRTVREALYMPALSVFRAETAFASFIASMKSRGKANKVILMALARKLLTIANACLRDREPYRHAT